MIILLSDSHLANEFCLIVKKSLKNYNFLRPYIGGLGLLIQFLTPFMALSIVLKSIPNDRFFRNFSWQFYLFSEFLPKIKSPKKYFLFFFFNVQPGFRTLALRLISQHYTTYQTTAMVIRPSTRLFCLLAHYLKRFCLFPKFTHTHKSIHASVRI